jgi:hypothetical protein
MELREAILSRAEITLRRTTSLIRFVAICTPIVSSLGTLARVLGKSALFAFS